MADLDDFKQAVTDACQCFSTQDWNKLEGMLHEYVVMKRIDDSEKYHSGKRNVMNYFHGNGENDKAKFEYNLNESSWQIIHDHAGAARIGVASGSGKFWDTAKTKQPRLIAFSFSFVKVNQRWLALNLWGAYADKPY